MSKGGVNPLFFSSTEVLTGRDFGSAQWIWKQNKWTKKMHWGQQSGFDVSFAVFCKHENSLKWRMRYDAAEQLLPMLSNERVFWSFLPVHFWEENFDKKGLNTKVHVSPVDWNWHFFLKQHMHWRVDSIWFNLPFLSQEIPVALVHQMEKACKKDQLIQS